VTVHVHSHAEDGDGVHRLPRSGTISSEATYTQFRSERHDTHHHDLDWLAVLGVVHRVSRGARSALAEPPGPEDAAP
jgi:hypothetical protein